MRCERRRENDPKSRRLQSCASRRNTRSTGKAGGRPCGAVTDGRKCITPHITIATHANGSNLSNPPGPGELAEVSAASIIGTRPTLHLGVDTIDARLAELARTGVALFAPEPTHRRGTRRLVARDPDGNLIAFGQDDAG